MDEENSHCEVRDGFYGLKKFFQKSEEGKKMKSFRKYFFVNACVRRIHVPINLFGLIFQLIIFFQWLINEHHNVLD